MDKRSWIKQACQSLWQKVVEKIKHAVVFIDFPCAECLFWNGGPMLLLTNGAVDIKDFSSFESGSENQRKAVFIVSSLLKGKTLSVLEDIIRNSDFDYCVIFTTVDAESHKIAYGSDIQDGSLVFEQCEENVCQWMGNMNYTCEVAYAPLYIAPYTPFLFLIPSLNNMFPLIKQDIVAIDSVRKSKGEKHSIERLSDIHFFSLPINYQVQIKKLSIYFNQLFETLNCKEELFTVGHTSRLIATQLANLPSARQRRKVAMTTASLLLVDRSLDTAGPTHHSEDSLIDKILGILPELPGHCNNISVDMLRLTSAKSLVIDEDDAEGISDVVTCPGCLCPPDDSCPQLLEDMITMPQKDAMKSIKRSLLEACIEEGLDVPGEEVGKSFSDEIFQLVESFHGNSGAIMYHNNLLQLSMAAAQTISNDFYEKWTKLSALEKLITIEEENPLVKISELINEDDEGGIKQWAIDDVLSLLVYICSLQDVSNTSDDVWDDLSSSLSLMISDSTFDELPEGLCEVLNMNESDNNIDLDQIQDVVEQIVEKLKSLYSLRDHLQQFKTLKKQTYGPPLYRPLLHQLLRKILDRSKPDLQPDIEHISTGLMDLLKSGFSMFKKVTKPRPNDARVMFVFVVGGITFEEAHTIHKMVQEYNSANRQDLQIIVGSTRITSPSDVIDKLLFANNLSPGTSE